MRPLVHALALSAVLIAGAGPSWAGGPNDRLVIVNGNSGHVVYDDGRDDLFCVTRRRTVGYDDWGYPVHRRTMHCR